MTKIRKQAVVISRHWDNPVINVRIYDDGIELDCKLDDFLDGLVEEMQHPLRSFTRARQTRNIQTLRDVVLNKIKEASSQVVA